jgi:hypothetical protein
MQANDVLNKTAEIQWCWDRFDNILFVLNDRELADSYKLDYIKYFVKSGLKGRQDEREN